MREHELFQTASYKAPLFGTKATPCASTGGTLFMAQMMMVEHHPCGQTGLTRKIIGTIHSVSTMGPAL